MKFQKSDAQYTYVGFDSNKLKRTMKNQNK